MSIAAFLDEFMRLWVWDAVLGLGHRIRVRLEIIGSARTAQAWSAWPRSMAALSGPAPTMTVLLGEATADFFIERDLILGKGHRAEDTFEAHEGMVGSGGTALENIVAAF